MPPPKRLALLVEGEADQLAAPVLIRKLFQSRPDPPWADLILDEEPPARIGSIAGLIKANRATREFDFTPWQTRLQRIARSVKNLGAVLLLLDGDEKKAIGGGPFCPGHWGRRFAEEARAAGAGKMFSLAVVFLVAEYESLFLASHETLPPLCAKPELLPAEPEKKRDAKGWLKRNLAQGYTNTADKVDLTQALDFEKVRERLPSFRRLERALDELVTGVRSGAHVATPAVKNA